MKKTKKADDLAGNPGKRTAQAATPICADQAGAEDCPEWLPAAARDEWRVAAPALKQPLRPEQVAPFACYCQAVADFRWATATLEKEGRTYQTPNGTFAEHPAAKIKKEAMQRIKAFAAEFGLTPASRARVPEPKEQPDKDNLGEFLARGPQA